MKSTEVKILKMDDVVAFDINAKLYLEMIDIRNFCVFEESHDEKIKKINQFLGNKKIANLEDGYQFITQLMLGDPNLQKSKVLVRGREYCSVHAERKSGIITVWHCNHEYRGEIIGMGAFTDNVLVRADKSANLPDMVMERPDQIAKEFTPSGGKFSGKHYVLDVNGILWELDGDFWIKDPKVEQSIKRFFSPSFGGGVMAQAVMRNILYSLLENGMVFDGNGSWPKKQISEKEYGHLVELAAHLFWSWNSVSTGDGWDRSEHRDVHKDISPCLYYEA